MRRHKTASLPRLSQTPALMTMNSELEGLRAAMDQMQVPGQEQGQLTLEVPNWEGPPKRGPGRPKGARNKAPKLQQMTAEELLATNHRAPKSGTGGSKNESVQEDSPPDEEMSDAQWARYLKRESSKREKKLTQAYFMVGLAALRFGGPADGAVFLATYEVSDGGDGLNNCQRLAKSVAGYCEVNESFAAIVDGLLQKSALTVMISTHATVAVALLQNHGIVPTDFMKAISARVLSRFKVSRATQQQSAAAAAG